MLQVTSSDTSTRWPIRRLKKNSKRALYQKWLNKNNGAAQDLCIERVLLKRDERQTDTSRPRYSEAHEKVLVEGLKLALF